MRGALIRLDLRRRRLSNAMQLLGWDRATGPPTTTGANTGGNVSGSADATPVIMCVWRRVDQLERTITMLQEQTHPHTELHLWNNNWRLRHTVDNIVRNARYLPISVTHSKRNIGGFGRFYLARFLADRHKRVILVDDDETFTPTMVEDLAAEFEPRSIYSFWAFRFTSPDDYWSRVAVRPGERADYCATCGMVVDTHVFTETGFFRCPRRFWFVEDLWLSFYADHLLGWNLRKSSVEFGVDLDGRDQFTLLHRRKSTFLRYLVAKGWKVPRADAGGHSPSAAGITSRGHTGARHDGERDRALRRSGTDRRLSDSLGQEARSWLVRRWLPK